MVLATASFMVVTNSRCQEAVAMYCDECMPSTEHDSRFPLLNGRDRNFLKGR